MQQETETRNSKSAGCDCIICAAGESSRMGSWKPLLPWGKKTIIEAAVGAPLEAGCRVILVTGANAELLGDLFPQTANLVSVRNELWKKGMVSSIRCGASLVRSEYFFVTHADMPRIPSHIYGTLLAAAREREFACTPLPFDNSASADKRPLALRPRFEGAPGHPVLFGRGSLPLIAALPDGESMKAFLGRCDLQFVDTEERGVILDLDNPGIYEEELAGLDIERAGRGILVLTGGKGTGKTTRIGRAFDRAAARGMNAVLVRQTETGRSADGRATGFDMEMCASRRDGALVKLTLPLARTGDDAFDPVSRIELGPYVFDRSVFARALGFVGAFIGQTGNQARFFGIDEIGRLELERSDGLLPAFAAVVAAVRKARAEGSAQHLVCTARFDTLEKLEARLEAEGLEADIQVLRGQEDFSRRRFP